MSTEEIFSQGREKLLSAILNGTSITKVMTEPNPICPLLETELKFGKKLGEGNYGEVFKMDIPGKGKREYAVKKAILPALKYHKKPGRKITYMDLAQKFKMFPIKIMEYNNITEKNVGEDIGDDDILIPTFTIGCLLKGDTSYSRFDGTGYTHFHAGDHLCAPPNSKDDYLDTPGHTATSEFAISLLTGSLYRSGRSINFLDVFYFATCIDKSYSIPMYVNQYTFMEVISSSTRKTIKCICEQDRFGKKTEIYLKDPKATENAMNSIIIQILHSIHMYLSVYKIVHGDLHDDNVFIEFVNEKTEWKGQKLIEADYYEYRINGKSIYVPGGRECPFIIKIGDWGLSCKYSDPQIANKMTIETGYDQGDGNGPWLPNFYTEMYDMYMIMDILRTLNPSNLLLKTILGWILKVPYDSKDALRGASLIRNTTRPDIYLLDSKEYSHVSPKGALLNDAIMSKFYIKPEEGSKIILLGE